MAGTADELREVLTDASRTQFAAVSAAVAFWSAWTESAAAYARGMADELAELSRGDASSDDVIGHMVDLNREYLRKLTELPAAAADRFDEEIKKIDSDRSRATGSRKSERGTRTRSGGTRKSQRRAKAKP
jgi:hypothetical protein